MIAEAIGELGSGAGEVVTGVVRDKLSASKPTTATTTTPPAPGAAPAPASPTTPRTPSPQQAERIAKVAEEVANLSPEEADARFAELEKEINGTPAAEAPKSAAESAEVFAKTATEKSAVDSADVFQKTEAAYKKDPIGTDPDRRIKELKEELAVADADWNEHVAKVGAEAVDAPRKQALEERRAAIEQQLVEAERVRQSNKGGADLKNDLAQRSSEPPAPPTPPPAPAPAPKPAGPSPLGEQRVKVEVRRGSTGETVQVEMSAKVAEKRITEHVTTLNKVLACLHGK